MNVTFRVSEGGPVEDLLALGLKLSGLPAVDLSWDERPKGAVTTSPRSLEAARSPLEAARGPLRATPQPFAPLT